MKKILALVFLAFSAAALRAQIIDSEPGVVGNIPVNYTEAKTGAYTLPDPLKFADGSPVTDAKAWLEKRRPELFKLIEENQYGRVPPRPPEMTFNVFDKGTPAFDGKALRKQVTIYFTASKTENYLDLLLYLPANATGPVPVLLEFGWAANNLAAASDPGVKVGRMWSAQEKKRIPADPNSGPARGPGRNLNVMQMIERGYGVAVFNYTDIDPDAPNAAAQGVRAAYLKPGQTEPAPDEWGSIAAWGWGASRIIDYFETDPQIDAKRIAITGASRLGKTVLWTAARDERVACVIASVSGEGGAALSRRDYGETIAHLVAPTRYPYQFAINYQKWAGKANDMPWDGHSIISLVAPRPILLQTGSTDKWSDPYGEFLAAKAATPVFALLGQKGIDVYSLPATGKPLMNTLGYLMHDGPHGVMPTDWPVFLDFLDAHLKPVVPPVAATPAATPNASTNRPRAPQSVSLRDAEPWTPGDFSSLKASLPTLIIAGDSTADKGSDAWHRGWAAPLVDYFDAAKINVVNRSRGGRSFRSFVHEGLWDQLIAAVKPGDIVMIQMGHNDGGDIKAANGRPDLPGIGDETETVTRADGATEVVHTFGWYARKWIADVRAKQATPVLMSQTIYNRWTDGRLNRRPSNIYTWMRQVAETENTPFLDHTNLIADRYEQLGEEAVKPFFAADPLHTTTFGAVVNAELFVAGVKALKLDLLVNALNEKGRAIESASPSSAPAPAPSSVAK